MRTLLIYFLLCTSALAWNPRQPSTGWLNGALFLFEPRAGMHFVGNNFYFEEYVSRNSGPHVRVHVNTTPTIATSNGEICLSTEDFNATDDNDRITVADLGQADFISNIEYYISITCAARGAANRNQVWFQKGAALTSSWSTLHNNPGGPELQAQTRSSSIVLRGSDNNWNWLQDDQIVAGRRVNIGGGFWYYYHNGVVYTTNMHLITNPIGAVVGDFYLGAAAFDSGSYDTVGDAFLYRAAIYHWDSTMHTRDRELSLSYTNEK